MTKLGLFCERLLEACWLVAIAAVPMYFDIYSSRVFEPDKISVLRSLVVVMALAQLVRWLEGSSGRSAGQDDGRAEVSSVPWRLWWPWWSTNPLAFPTAVVVATYLLGTLVSVTPGISIWGGYQRLQGTYSMLAYITLFFLMAANLRRRSQLERLFNVMLLVSLPISVYGIAQHLQKDPLPWGGDVVTRVTSTMGNAIFLAAYLIMVVPIALQRLMGTIARLRRIGPVPEDKLFEGAGRVLILVSIIVAELVFFTAFTALSAKPISLWWAVLPAIGTFAALAVLFSIPRPTYLTTLLEAVGYVFLLALHLTAILLTQSRGPWLGLMAGLICFAIVLFVRRRARGLLFTSAALAVAVVSFLVVFNLNDSPLASLRSVPYVGRLGVLFESEGGTGRVRTLIWQGTWQLMTTRPPIGLATADPLGPARVLVGYGPESMYVAYNKVYPPDLAHYEARNASPDRNHNDILDHLLEVGVLGLLAYLFLLGAVAYLIWRLLRRADTLADQLPLVAILSALVAHLVESQTGIVIAATRSYFWVYLAVLASGTVLFGSRARSLGTSPVAADTTVPAAAGALTGSVVRARPPRRPRANSSAVRLERTRQGNMSGAGTRGLAEGGVAVYPTLILVGILLLVTLVLSSVPSIQDARLPLYLSFFGLVVAAGFIALGLGRYSAVRFWQGANWWAYGLATLAVAYIVAMNLNVVAADIYYKRGLGYDQARRFDGSVMEYNKALALAGDQDYYYLFLGRSFLELAKQSQRPKATPAFEPTQERLRNVTPTQLNALGRDDLLNASQAVLEEARNLNPLNTDHYANLGRLYRVRGEMGDRSKLEQASSFYRQATTVSPQAAHLYDEWAQVDLLLGAPEEALAKTKIAAALDPIFLTSFVVMGDAYQMAGKGNEALEAHGKALALNPGALSDPMFEQRIAAYEKAGLIEQVEALYAKAVKDAPTLPAAHAAYGFILSRQNKSAEALAEFQTNVQLVPSDWVAHRNLALLYQSLGMLDQAISSAQAAQRYAPQDQVASVQSLVSDLQKRKQ